MSTGRLRIDGETVEATHFAFDGCHKIYLIGSVNDMLVMRRCGYTGGNIRPVSEFKQVWDQTCPLRFIKWADLRRPDPVRQAYTTEPAITWAAT